MIDVPKTRYAVEGELRIAYQTVGDGPLELIFATGGQYPIDLLWDEPRAARFLRRLALFSRVVVFDARGWGASRMAAMAPTVESWADDQRLVLDTIGVGKPAVVGHFAGAFFSTYFAATHPERVSSLVLLEGFSRITRAADYPAGTPSDVVDAATAAYIDMYGTGEDLAWFAPSLANDLHFRDWWARCERLANGPVGAALYWQELASRDMRAVLPALRMPTLIVHRREDQFIRVEHGRYLAERIPGATYVELDGDDHMFFTGDSDQIVDEIEVFLTGVRAAPDIDRMLASVLFTDIVASTDKAAALGDRRWREILDQHDALTRSQVARFRGRVVKTTGDGTLATFDGPARAIQCACVLRDAAHDMGLELRAGIHTGEVERRDDDVGGIAVHLAARVQSVARPDEVIVSRTVTDLVAGSGIAFHDRGEHDLKGIPGQWRLFAVAG